MIPNNHPYDVAVIMINYNSSNYSIKCINSIIEKTKKGLRYKIIIIDNASEKKDSIALKNAIDDLGHEHITLFRSRVNLGFSGGNMLGIQYANADYYFFLNNDCEILNDCLGILHSFCVQNPSVGLCSPQLYKAEGGDYEPCIDYFPTLSTKILGTSILKLTYGKRFFKRKQQYMKPVEVDVISGSQMFIRASSFHEIGGFDTTFFLYSEEEDIALILFKKGIKTFLVPDAHNLHAGGGSTEASLDIKKEFYISFFYFYNKHYGRFKTSIIRLITALRLVRRSIHDRSLLPLLLFVIKGAPLKDSLRHKQKIHDALTESESAE